MAKEYESEHTIFMRQWLAAHPEELQEQKDGRAMWWDKPQDAAAQRGYDAAKVKQEAYFGNGM